MNGETISLLITDNVNVLTEKNLCSSYIFLHFIITHTYTKQR